MANKYFDMMDCLFRAVVIALLGLSLGWLLSLSVSNPTYSGTCPSCGGVPKVVTNNTRHYLQCWQCGKCMLVLHDKKCGDKCIIKAEGVE